MASWTLIASFSATSGQPHCRIRQIPSVGNGSTSKQHDSNSLSQLKRLHLQFRLPRSFQIASKSNRNIPSALDDATLRPSTATKSRARLASIKRWVRRAVASLSFASTVFLSRPSVSSAVSTVAITAKQKTAISIRPGMSRTQVDALEHGDVSVVEQLEQAPTVFQASTPDVVGKMSSKVVDSYGDLDDEDDDLSLLVSDDDFASSSKAARQEDKAIGERLRASTSEQFAAYHQKKTVGLTLKVGLAFFGPTYGFMIGREYVRRRREEAYVKKGLEILEAQKAEYFNITGTSNDADVEDALKGLKSKNTTTSTNDEDDDEDDEDPEPPSSARRAPRKPLGDPPKSGDDSGGGSVGKSENDKPSAADIDKLNKLLGKS
jgi:hypothetical protein